MPQRNDGHPMAAMLLLFSMFAFALVFHAVTRPAGTLAGHFNTQLAALAQPVKPRVLTRSATPAPGPARAPHVVHTETSPPITPATTLDAAVGRASEPAIDATPASPALAYLPASINAAPPQLSADSRGAVTRGLDATSSALRMAFRKAF